MFPLVFLCITLCGTVAGQDEILRELIRNGGFEDEIRGEWYCQGCSMKRTGDRYEGLYSLEVTDR